MNHGLWSLDCGSRQLPFWSLITWKLLRYVITHRRSNIMHRFVDFECASTSNSRHNVTQSHRKWRLHPLAQHTDVHTCTCTYGYQCFKSVRWRTLNTGENPPISLISANVKRIFGSNHSGYGTYCTVITKSIFMLSWPAAARSINRLNHEAKH